MNNLVKEIKRKIGKKRLFYVCRDVERAAAGLLLGLQNFYIITNDGPYARELQKKYGQKIIVVKSKNLLDTHELLAFCHPEATYAEGSSRRMGEDSSYSFGMTIKQNDLILVFKPTTQIEKICAQNGWRLLNPSAELSRTVEEKISQIKWLGALVKKYLPPHKIDILKNLQFSGEPFVLQFNHGHTGNGTILIKSKKQLANLIKKFPDRPARVTRYVDGSLFTNNNIVWGDKILLGNINYQITGLKPFTNNKFATIGNDWALPHKILSATQKKKYYEIAKAVGERLAKDGWRGLFGIDVVMDAHTQKMYLLEINARQPASTTFESELQHLTDNNGITTFDAHLSALLGTHPDSHALTKIFDGAQIVKRVGGKKIPALKSWRQIKYRNTEPGADEIRFQFLHGIMTAHNKLKI